MMDYGKRYQQAETLRKSGLLQEAAEAFRALWDEQPNPRVGWRWVFCLRKLGRTQEAMDGASRIIAMYPEDAWVQREYAWCIYTQEIRAALAANDLGRTVHFAQKMLDVVQDELVKKMAVFAVTDIAKERVKWDIVSQWCDRLDPLQLSLEQNASSEQRSMSDRERWYYAKVKALINLREWTQARKHALEAQALFPRKDDFPRWAAQARASEGDIVGAAEEIEALIRRGNAQWYILADLAQMKFRLAQNEEALRIACKAALAFGEDKAKVNLFALLAEVGLALNQGEFAAYHVALAKALRQREGWSVKEDLLSLEQRVKATLVDIVRVELPTEPHQLLSYCQKEWRKWSAIGQTRYTGKICNLPEGKHFGFIAPDKGGENIHVLLRVLPKQARFVGAYVEYSLEPSFDHKKNRESVRAIDVCLVSPGKEGSGGR
jgi:tetratricopeptide (TPR) repeat protein